MKNCECEGDDCKESTGQVKVVPLGELIHTHKGMIPQYGWKYLCRACFDRAMSDQKHHVPKSQIVDWKHLRGV